MPGLRDILLVLLVLAAIYLVVLLIRLTRVGRNRRSERSSPLPVEHAEPVATATPERERSTEPGIPPAVAISAYVDEVEEAAPQNFTVPPAPTFEWDDVKDLFGETAGEETSADRPARGGAPRQGGFGEALAEHLARSDVETEIQHMRDEMERMRREMEEMRTARRVSPQYAEAMELAQRGCSAQDVADRLGISLAEAELVQALSRSRQNLDEGEEHGADGNPGGFDVFGGRHAG
jgi:hypothetical protein